MRQSMRMWAQVFEISSLATGRKGVSWGEHHRFQCRALSSTGAGSFSDAIRAPGKQNVLLAFHSDNQEVPLDEKHRFPMSKYRLTRLALEEDASVRDLIEIREVTNSTRAPYLHHSNACITLVVPGTGFKPGGLDRALQ